MFTFPCANRSYAQLVRFCKNVCGPVNVHDVLFYACSVTDRQTKRQTTWRSFTCEMRFPRFFATMWLPWCKRRAYCIIQTLYVILYYSYVLCIMQYRSSFNRKHLCINHRNMKQFNRNVHKHIWAHICCWYRANDKASSHLCRRCYRQNSTWAKNLRMWYYDHFWTRLRLGDRMR